MLNEILPATPEQRRSIIHTARTIIIPDLVRENYPAERCLRIFHELGAIYSPPLPLESAKTIEGYIALFSGIQPSPFLDVEDLSPERFSRYDDYTRGGYRIIGVFPPNHELARYAEEANTYFLAATPVSTKDYHSQNNPHYYPPVFNIHRLMFMIGVSFDTRFELATSMEEVAQSIADFYFWGLAIIHPYLGGNHRAFDRFLEYAFYKKGFDVKPPIDKTLNIPPETRFNKEIYAERRRLLEQAGLSNCNFPERGLSIYNPDWLTYQHNLNEFIIESLNNGSGQTGEIVDALMHWR